MKYDFDRTVLQSDSKLLSEFPWPVNGNPDNNLESYRTNLDSCK
jgi:hypothetical protein